MNLVSSIGNSATGMSFALKRATPGRGILNFWSKTMSSTGLLRKTYSFEHLESRTVLNGTVMATGAGGALVLTGDAGNNGIVVRQIGTNSDGSGAIIQVVGAGSKINNLDTGKTGAVFT